jgi:hypothetical protein
MGFGGYSPAAMKFSARGKAATIVLAEFVNLSKG